MEPGPDDQLDAALATFARLVAETDGSADLDATALAMSGVLQPGLDTVAWLVELDEIAGRCPSPTRDGVVDHVVRGEGFTGDRSTYGDWRNSCLDHVIRGRRGIPITLSVLVVEVARRVGVSLVGVGMPAHFLVGDPDDPDWFADPFGGGQRLDAAGCRSLFESLTRAQVPWRDEFVRPTSRRAVVARMLNNLKQATPRRTDPVRHALVMRMRGVMPELADEEDEVRLAQAVFN
jgi:hypothetical protein